MNAYSCDIIDCSGGRPEWHIKGDAFSIVKMKWDMIIAHPPCTYLCRQANRWIVDRGLESEFEAACYLFNHIRNCGCEKVCIENPIPHRRAKEAIGNYTQII